MSSIVLIDEDVSLNGVCRAFCAARSETGKSSGGNCTSKQVEGIDYYPYGQARVDTVSNPYAGAKYKYAQTQYDQAVALNYAQNRYQNPAQGTFISEDPILQGSQLSNDALSDPQR
jgi:RHS repeat-associated protein